MSETIFERVERDTGHVWLHKSKPVWIVLYEAVDEVGHAYYQAYRAIAAVPAGRDPWTVDNRRLGDPNHGYRSLDDAMEAAA